MSKLWLPATAVIVIALAAFTACFRPQAIIFMGMCDASAAASIDADHFIVANDEDNTLRVYRRTGGEPISEHELSAFLTDTRKKKAKETDIEAAAKVGSRIYWISSHGRNSKGKDAPERERIFATDVTAAGDRITISPAGQPYENLLDDLIADPRLKKYDFAGASEKAPKDAGALNIEGLAATPENHLLIGFRNPIRNGRTLVVPLLNPEGIVRGERARLGDPIELDLGGLGIRSLGRHGGQYVIVAGAIADGGESQLFTWDGTGQPQRVPGVSFRSLNPEGIAFPAENGPGEYFVLSDDGGVDIEGKDCKKLKDPAMKRFRGRAIEL